jgi:hypothetical protein
MQRLLTTAAVLAALTAPAAAQSDLHPGAPWAFGLIFALIVFSLVVPFLPAIIALCRRHARTGTIFVLNILFSVVLGIPLAFTGFGILLIVPFWIWIFIWAVMGEKRIELKSRLRIAQEATP